MLSIYPPPEIIYGGEAAWLGLPQELGVGWVRGGHGGCEGRKQGTH